MCEHCETAWKEYKKDALPYLQAYQKAVMDSVNRKISMEEFDKAKKEWITNRDLYLKEYDKVHFKYHPIIKEDENGD